MRLPFEKWEGHGNDFILIEQGRVARELTDEEVRLLCDRRRGIGADGVLMIDRPSGATGSMVIRNADGTRPEMCGNGIRCVAGFLLGDLSGDASMIIRTDSGDLTCRITVVGAGAVNVEVDMGMARFKEPLEVDVPTDSGCVVHRFDRVSMGNPHAITFEAYDDGAIDLIAPIVERFPANRTNVEFVRVEGQKLSVRVWERGVGYTEACGTGACAVAAIACKKGLARFDEEVTVGLPGGDLAIRVDGRTHAVSMRGPARRAFQGETRLI